MFRILVAEIQIDIEPRYDLIEEWCREYQIDRNDNAGADLMIHISDEELQQEIRTCPYGLEPDEAEIICVSKALGRELPRFDALFLHAAVFTVGGRTFGISARSGTGKTTLLRHCKELLGRNVNMINGDKPIIRWQNAQLIVYGTPWRGKERWGENVSAPLTDLILLSRGDKNRIEEADPFRSLADIVQHIYVPEKGYSDPERFLGVIGRLLEQSKVYRMTCTDSLDAARVLFAGTGVYSGEGENEIQD